MSLSSSNREACSSGPEGRRSTAGAAILRSRATCAAPSVALSHLVAQRFGNRALQRLQRARLLQAKLTVSRPDDVYEQEADRAADEVMRIPEPTHDRAPLDGSGAPPRIQRLCAECEEEMQRKAAVEDEEPRVQAKREGAGLEDGAAAISRYVDSLSGRGEPLAPSTRAFMEPRFGVDFSAVRIHADAQAGAAARSINARAFTVGPNVAFATGEYDPRSERGRNLIAHELVHVLQQGAQRGAPHLQARVVDDDAHLPCRATAGRSAAYLSAREAAAATMAEESAAALRASPIGEPERRLLWERFRLDYNDPVIRCRQVAEIADRFARAAREIRGTDCEYNCVASGEPEGECQESHPNAYTYVGVSRSIDLCDGFWRRRSPDEQEETLLHEWMHYVYLPRGVGDEPAGGFDTAECYAIFADIRRRGAAAQDLGCPKRTEPVPAGDPSRQAAECPSNVFGTVTALGGYAHGLGGHHYGLVGGGLDVNLPLTRMHDWELTLGPRFTALLPTDTAARASYLTGIRAGISFRYRPWRFGFQVGGYAEGGGATLPTATDSQATHPYLAGGVAAALNFRLGDRTALQIVGDVGGGAVLGRIDTATGEEARRGWFGVGLGLALQVQ